MSGTELLITVMCCRQDSCAEKKELGTNTLDAIKYHYDFVQENGVGHEWERTRLYAGKMVDASLMDTEMYNIFEELIHSTECCASPFPFTEFQ